MGTEVGSDNRTSVSPWLITTSRLSGPAQPLPQVQQNLSRGRVEFASLKFQDIRLLMTLSFLWPKVNWTKTLVSYIRRLGNSSHPTSRRGFPDSGDGLLCRHEHPVVRAVQRC